MNKRLLYFSAEWCQPCTILGPIMDSLKKQIPIEKINVDYEPDVNTRYNVGSIPTVILVKDNKEIDRFVGVRTEQQIINFFNSK